MLSLYVSLIYCSTDILGLSQPCVWQGPHREPAKN